MFTILAIVGAEPHDQTTRESGPPRAGQMGFRDYADQNRQKTRIISRGEIVFPYFMSVVKKILPNIKFMKASGAKPF